MNAIVFEELAQAAGAEAPAGARQRGRIDGIVVGRVVGFAENDETPLVTYAQQPGTAALRARAVVDLHEQHVGRDVALMFEDGDPRRPIVMGYVRGEKNWQLPDSLGQIEVEADGERLVVSAKEQIVLRCGKASITLTKTGKVLISGTFVSSRSSGVNRVAGRAVQLN